MILKICASRLGAQIWLSYDSESEFRYAYLLLTFLHHCSISCQGWWLKILMTHCLKCCSHCCHLFVLSSLRTHFDMYDFNKLDILHRSVVAQHHCSLSPCHWFLYLFLFNLYSKRETFSWRDAGEAELCALSWKDGCIFSFTNNVETQFSPSDCCYSEDQMSWQAEEDKENSPKRGPQLIWIWTLVCSRFV